jgi:hypothetical protein
VAAVSNIIRQHDTCGSVYLNTKPPFDKNNVLSDPFPVAITVIINRITVLHNRKIIYNIILTDSIIDPVLMKLLQNSPAERKKSS